MTAGHVLEKVFSHRVAAIGFPGSTGARWHGSSIREKELLGCDIGVFRAEEVPHAPALNWGDGGSLLLCEGVQAIGYPYGLDLELRTVVVRAFQGHIVSERKFARLAERPRVYELSFQGPRGLSGAPLLTTEGEGRVAGVIVGNAITEMEVYSEREELKEPGRETVLIKTEALHLGIAVTANEILNLRSQLLGGTVREGLKASSLLRDDRA